MDSSSLDDLAKQYKIEYAPMKGSASETYFRRMAEIEEQFYKYLTFVMHRNTLLSLHGPLSMKELVCLKSTILFTKRKFWLV